MERYWSFVLILVDNIIKTIIRYLIIVLICIHGYISLFKLAVSRNKIIGYHTCSRKGIDNILGIFPDSNKLNPNYVTGFVDGEGSFIVKVLKRSRLRAGFEVQLCFQITSHPKDRALLERIRDYFGGVGSIHKEGSGCLQYRVSSNKDLNSIVKHFENFPLITQKYGDYLLFKSVLEICNLKEHLSPEGINRIVNIKASMNKGLAEGLKEAFPNAIPVVRPEVKNQVVKDPH